MQQNVSYERNGGPIASELISIMVEVKCKWNTICWRAHFCGADAEEWPETNKLEGKKQQNVRNGFKNSDEKMCERARATSFCRENE